MMTRLEEWNVWWVWMVGVQLCVATSIYLGLRCYYNKHIARRVTPDSTQTIGQKLSFMKLPHQQLQHRMSIFEEVPGKEVNPFVNMTWYVTNYEAIKCSLMAVTLLPVRLVLFIALHCVVSLWLYICLLGVNKTLGRTPPLSKCRSYFMRPAVWLWMRGGLFIVGFYWIRHRGKRLGVEAAPVVVCNHLIGFEAMLMCAAFHCSPVAAVEQITIGLMRPLVVALQTVPVDRKSEASRSAVLNAIKERATRTNTGGIDNPQVLIFPEGTCHNGNAIINFKIGAFAPGTPVQPAVVRFPFMHCDVSWVFTGPGALMLLFRILTQIVNFMDVEFLPAHVPSDAEKADPKLFAKSVREKMAAALGVPYTFHGVDDVLLQFKAIKAGQTPEAALIPGGMESVQQFFSVTKSQIENHFVNFVSMDKDRKGVITLDKFITAFEECAGHKAFPEQREHLTVLFSLLDPNDCGKIEFKEFLLGLALSKPGNDDQSTLRNRTRAYVQGRKQRREILRLAFNAFDRSGQGRISYEDCAGLMKRIAPGDEAVTSTLNRMFSAASETKVASPALSSSSEGSPSSTVIVTEATTNAPATTTTDTSSSSSSSSSSSPSSSPVSGSSTQSKTVSFDEFEAFMQTQPAYMTLFQANFYNATSP